MGSTEFNGKLIVIEGNMGIGKSTLAKQIAEKMNYKVMDEPVESNPYLEKFYKNPKKYALEMQLWIMINRYQQHRQAIEHICDTGQSVIMDRSIHGDYMFCKTNHEFGNITKEGYESYRKIKRTLLETIPKPEILIYLDADADVIFQRINERARGCEAKIAIEYIEALNQNYRVWARKYDGNKLFQFPYKEYISPETFIQFFGLKHYEGFDEIQGEAKGDGGGDQATVES